MAAGGRAGGRRAGGGLGEAAEDGKDRLHPQSEVHAVVPGAAAGAAGPIFTFVHCIGHGGSSQKVSSDSSS